MVVMFAPASAGSNTVKGIGKYLQYAGEKIEHTAKKK